MKRFVSMLLGVASSLLLTAFPVLGGNQITIIAGGGTQLPQVGLQATAVSIDSYVSKVDVSGNIYIAEDDYNENLPGRGFVRVNNFGVVDEVLLDPGFIEYIDDLAVDSSGNVYLPFHNQFCVYKVTPTKEISVYAGVCGASGYSGDNGPATSALLETIESVAVDLEGNLYINNYHGTPGVIRKVDRQGIITTLLNDPTLGSVTDSLYSDGIGNLYFYARDQGKVYKTDLAGGNVAFAGSGTNGHSGDGLSALAANIGDVIGIAGDKWGNVFIAYGFEGTNYIRKIDANGIITTVASWPYDGSSIARISADGDGSIFLTIHNNRIDKLTFDPEVSSLTPADGSGGQVVKLAGRYFLNRGAGGTVTFGGVQAQVLSWSNEMIVCKVPQGLTRTVPVIVTTKDGQVSPAVSFRVR